MTLPNTNYDETSDTLYISFAAGEKATGLRGLALKGAAEYVRIFLYCVPDKNVQSSL